MRITEDNYLIFIRAEILLKKTYDYNIKDDTFEGYMDEDAVLTIIEDLCDEIEILQRKNEENDYPDEERDREKQIGIL